ncbi:MAG: hypothetical protein CFE40_08530 [Burkholderiales bacterium PBB1]|nr:MAG: hypothetical protein CFE40_08530 [Burkholderiales bacterium PBB1]
MTLRSACIASWVMTVLTAPALAQDIYRCGSNGNTYSQVPCTDGRRIELTDARNDEQRLQARQVNERTVALAESLERDRLASEAAARPRLAGSFSAPTKKVSTKASRAGAQAKAKKRLRLSSQAAHRRAPKSTQEAVLAQPRN